jgi:hypothetical protein
MVGRTSHPGSGSHWAFAIVIRDLQQVCSRKVISAGCPASVFRTFEVEKRGWRRLRITMTPNTVVDRVSKLSHRDGVLTSDPVKGYAGRGLQFVMEDLG